MTANAFPASLVSVKDGKPVTTSLVVAQSFGKNHRDVLRSIDTIIESNFYQEREMGGLRNFAQGSYFDSSNNQTHRLYEMDRQGFEILAMGFTGEEALRWKFQYSDAFAAMEQALLDQRILAAHPQMLTCEHLNRLQPQSVLSLQSRQGIQAMCRQLKIVAASAYQTTPMEEMMAKPGWIDSRAVIPIVATVLDDILNWRYPYPYVYSAFDYARRGIIYLHFSHLFDHLRRAAHLTDFFTYMKSGAQFRIEQALMQGPLPKIKKGPIVNDVRMNCRLDVENFLEKMAWAQEQSS